MNSENLFNKQIHWDKTQTLRKLPSGKKEGTKNALLSRAPLTHHSFTFNLQFLCELKHDVRFSKTVCGKTFLRKIVTHVPYFHFLTPLFQMSFLNFVPHAPSRLTCLRVLLHLQTILPYVPYLPYLRALPTRLARLFHAL